MNFTYRASACVCLCYMIWKEERGRRTRYKVGFRDDNDGKKSAKKREKAILGGVLLFFFSLLSTTHAPDLASKA
jgi:hypothetical protein